MLRCTLHLTMIKTWQHKGLKKFYETGKTSGINPNHARRLTIILQLLDAAEKPKDLDLPGFNFHALKGELKNYYSVKVNGNWRIIFQFEEQDVILVNYLDYH
jgi:proteic killer suppression protein